MTQAEDGLRIGDLARQLGVSTRALRYYEEQGLLTSSRTTGGQRRYARDAADRVRTIRQLHAAGLPSRMIAKLTPCVIDGRATPELLCLLSAERDRLQVRLDELATMRRRLDAIISGATTSLLSGQPCQGKPINKRELSSD